MQTSDSHAMLLGEANFSEEVYQAVDWIAQKSLGSFFFFSAKDNAVNLFKIKSKSLNKETLFPASRKLLVFLKRCWTVYIFIKDYSRAV